MQPDIMTERAKNTSVAPRGSRGFALLITITLLAFVVVLLVGLAAYTRVETAVAGNTQRQAQARENALLALNVALGQLQKYAGKDQRVTATAESFENTTATSRYAGVWESDSALIGDNPATPLTWLVSGNEMTDADGVSQPLAVTPAAPGTSVVELVGRLTTGSNTRNQNYIIAPLQNITAVGVPGMPLAANTTIGRYAWWVGDQGVKAPVAVPDTTSSLDYEPYTSAELRSRVRQQMSLGAGAADASGNPVFDPQETSNATLVANNKVTATSQLAFLRRVNATTAVGLNLIRTNFHTWSPNNFGLLASTTLGGLRQDLSLNPGLLGGAFAAWANYPAYMEPLPAEGDPLRRRYVMTPHLLEDGGSHQVGLVLTDFGLTFNVRTVGGLDAADSPLEVRAAWMLSLWNPYTAALVPENLRVEVTGLPQVAVVNYADVVNPQVVSVFSLQEFYSVDNTPGGSLRILLPWDSQSVPASAPPEDRQSWLPGRVYTWSSVEDTTKADKPEEGYPARFYTRSFVSAGPNAGVQRDIPATVTGTDDCELVVSGGDTLMVTVSVLRDGNYVRVGRFTAPPFLTTFVTTRRAISAGTYQFAYVFRLKESIDTVATPSEWLTTPTVDFRRRTVPAEAYVFGNGDNPAAFENQLTNLMTAQPDRLLFRAGDAYSYNEDVPLYELPRAPLLSLGALQHFRLIGRRPFMIGNPWGVEDELNQIKLGELFDRFYLSGVTPQTTPTTNGTGDLVLPNTLQRPLRSRNGIKPSLDDFRAAPGERSSKYVLQGGAFNLNSVNSAAWAAVLRGVRFSTSAPFKYLNASETTGTAGDEELASEESTNAHFFRFSQSAQETYKAEPGKAEADADPPSPANTHLFRQGMRTLTAAQVDALATKIAELVGRKHAAAGGQGGPFRSLGEFVSPNALFSVPVAPPADPNEPPPPPNAQRSLIEAAIEDAGTNNAIAEFSSQWLTQADILTALAPVLFTRSDTFLIRTYGEVVNPATSATEGRAWCEALVQRMPEYMEPDRTEENPNDPSAPLHFGDAAETLPADLTSELNKTLGRRFKVVSFRWLTRSDI